MRGGKVIPKNVSSSSRQIGLISFSKIHYRFLLKRKFWISKPSRGCSIVYILFNNKQNIFQSWNIFLLCSHLMLQQIVFFFVTKRNLWSFYQEFWKSNFPLIATNFCLLQVLIFAKLPRRKPFCCCCVFLC